ncbi:MAG: PhoH family protein [Thermanaerothrix sp.]|nr:PhoH family protein [Thermanaerothrix sp.]
MELGSGDSSFSLRVRPFPGQDQVIREIEREFALEVLGRGDLIVLKGGDESQVRGVADLLFRLGEMDDRWLPIELHVLREAMDEIKRGGRLTLLDRLGDSPVVYQTAKGRQVRPYTAGQIDYVNALMDSEVTFAIGPAGTGKTYLAAAFALSLLKRGEISRVVLVRPVVEAGERLGFLPGDIMEKVEPYLRPLYDAFFDLLSPDKFMRLLDRKVIEIVPLAYMRGRTLNESFIILDEAQNTTPEQMKMFLTRMGMGSKAVVTGDVTQVDLPQGKDSGLLGVEAILGGIPGISFVRLSASDVVRHPIVQKIVRAYEDYEDRVRGG